MTASYCPATGKMTYEAGAARQAARALTARTGSKAHAYRCEQCGGHHLSRVAPDAPHIKRRRAG